MELKRITANDSRSATAIAMARYGKDALIISNERCGDKVQVLVAIDTETHAEEPVASPSRKGPAMAPGMPAEFAAALQESMLAMKAAHPDPAPDTRGRQACTAEPADSRPKAPASDESALQEQHRASELVRLIRDEFSEMRREFCMSQKVALWQSARHLDEAVAPLVRALEEAGVPARLRAMLADELEDKRSLEEGLRAIEAMLGQCVLRASGASALRGIHVLAGPSGAGKTLMLGKLALAHARARGCGPQGVALISYGPHCVGAWAQQQGLAARAGVDCFRAPSEQALGDILAEVKGRPVVLVDVPGRDTARSLEAIRALAPQAAAHVLLPAESSVATFRRWLGDGAPDWRSLMLSKLDEATHPWPLVQALLEYPVPLSFASDDSRIEKVLDAGQTGWLTVMGMRSLQQALDAHASWDVKDC